MVFQSSDLALFALAKAALEGEGIPYVADGEGIQDLFGIGRLGTGYNLITGRPRIRVMAEHVERAEHAAAGYWSVTPSRFFELPEERLLAAETAAQEGDAIGRLPTRQQQVIRLRAGLAFTVSAPFGRDSYILLASREPIPNIQYLEQEGVMRGAGGREGGEDNPLTSFLLSRGKTRGHSKPTPTDWSSERIEVESKPGVGAAKSN